MKIVSLFLFLVFNSASIFAGLNPGDKASDFSLVNVNGKKVSLSDYKDAKGFIIVFTCNHCPYAKMYEQRIIDLHNKYAGQGYPIIAINPNDPNEVPEDGMKQMKKLAKKKGADYVAAIDDNAKDATKVNQKYLELAIEEMKAGKDVTVKTTKAIGCSIKTKSKT